MFRIYPRALLAAFAMAPLLGVHAQTIATPAGADTTNASPLHSIPDPRLRELVYNRERLVSVLVRRGVVTHIEVDPGEHILYAASGVGSDCKSDTDPWCIEPVFGDHHVFVKPKSFASGVNNLEVVTNRRAYSIQFTTLAVEDPRQAALRVTLAAPLDPGPLPAPDAQGTAAEAGAPMPGASNSAAAAMTAKSASDQLVALGLRQAPIVVNTSYSIALGKKSQDIVPSMAFDDGRMTYIRFPGNRELPAVFQVAEDGNESMVNPRMEGDLLVVDRVARRFSLRLGNQVVALYNDAYDADGVPPVNGTTVSGVQRVVRPTRK
jgi:type IV secretion system protein VirB9